MIIIINFWKKNNAVKRFLSVDIAKGISIIAIVFGHIAYQYPFCQLVNTKDLFVYLWHVAVFFLLAGFLLRMTNLFNQNFDLRRNSHRFI